MKRAIFNSCVSLAVLSIASMSAPALAADQPAKQPAAGNGNADANGNAQNQNQDALSEIVVTAATGTKTQLDSSVSVSSVDASVVQDFHPMSEGDMLRLLPGLQPNVSGPGGNGNFAVRGLPVATGGATFVQLQEDGLPLVLYGDIQFGNNDYWTKSSPTDERISAIRGGTTATLASQAPGAVVNYISKTSRSDGGYVQLDKNLTYDYTKASFLLSGSINDSTYYNIGGYYDVGDGPWHSGYQLSNSYLVKGNVTKEFDGGNGFVRLYFKAQDTHEPNTQGGIACGTLSGGKITNLSACPGFDARKASNFSLYNDHVSYVDFNSGGLTTRPLDGISTNDKYIQLQLHYKFDSGLTVDDNARYNNMHGGFASNFLSVTPLASLLGSTVNGGTVARAVYSAGPNKGQDVTQPYYNNNVSVYTDIRNLNSFANDLKLNWQGGLGAGDLKANVTAGWFFMNQKIGMDWHPSMFNASLTPDASPIDLLDAAGNLLSANGYTGYNNNWGTCCSRTYDYSFTDNAPYLDLILDYDKFELDASVRHDINHGSGSGTASSGTVHTLTQTAVNPVTGASEQVNIPYFLPDGSPEVMNYTKPLTSWSVGASYKATKNLNLFIRASRGTRFNSDRMSFSGYFNANGTLDAAGQAAVADYVYQYEIGLKNRGFIGDARYTVELTAYHSHFNITTYELSQQVCPIVTGSPTTYTCIVADKYKTTGVEFYGTLRYHGFNLLANMTFNKAKKQGSAPGAVFKRSNNIPDLSYTLAASYDVSDALSFGVDWTGVTSTVDNSDYVWPGGSVVGANIKVRPIDNLEIALNVSNLFNKLTPLGPAGTDFMMAGGNFVGGISPMLGRNFTASAKFSF